MLTSENLPMHHHNQVAIPSMGQERMWYACQTHAHIPLYNIGFSMCLEGQFDVRIGEQAMNIIVQRHESLRTTFNMIDQRLKQIIAPELHINVPLIHRENIPLEKIPSEIKHIAKLEVAKYFDLQQGPLVRSFFIKFSEHHYGWVVILHHTISDGWSVGLFAYEANIIYKALATSVTPQLAPVAMQYKEYVDQQYAKIKNETFNQSLQYWVQRLKYLSLRGAMLAHPSSEETDEHDLARYYHTFSNEVVRSLHFLSKKYETTLFTICFVIFRLTLWKVLQQEDCVITVPTVLRSHYKLQKTMGYLLNLLPIRIAIDEPFDCEDFIKKVVVQLREDFAHPDVPIEYLSNYLQFEHPNPLLQTLFSLQNYPIPENIYNYKILDLCDYFDLTEFNLSMRISTYKKEWDMEIIYNVNLFTEPFIQDVVQQYLNSVMRLVTA